MKKRGESVGGSRKKLYLCTERNLNPKNYGKENPYTAGRCTDCCLCQRPREVKV